MIKFASAGTASEITPPPFGTNIKTHSVTHVEVDHFAIVLVTRRQLWS